MFLCGNNIKTSISQFKLSTKKIWAFRHEERKTFEVYSFWFRTCSSFIKVLLDVVNIAKEVKKCLYNIIASFKNLISYFGRDAH